MKKIALTLIIVCSLVSTAFAWTHGKFVGGSGPAGFSQVNTTTFAAVDLANIVGGINVGFSSGASVGTAELDDNNYPTTNYQGTTGLVTWTVSGGSFLNVPYKVSWKTGTKGRWTFTGGITVCTLTPGSVGATFSVPCNASTNTSNFTVTLDGTGAGTVEFTPGALSIQLLSTAPWGAAGTASLIIARSQNVGSDGLSDFDNVVTWGMTDVRGIFTKETLDLYKNLNLKAARSFAWTQTGSGQFGSQWQWADRPTTSQVNWSATYYRLGKWSGGRQSDGILGYTITANTSTCVDNGTDAGEMYTASPTIDNPSPGSTYPAGTTIQAQVNIGNGNVTGRPFLKFGTGCYPILTNRAGGVTANGGTTSGIAPIVNGVSGSGFSTFVFDPTQETNGAWWYFATPMSASVPVDIQVKFGNYLNIDMWTSTGVLNDDTYITNWLQDWNGLSSGLYPYLTNENEVWNQQFGTTRYGQLWGIRHGISNSGGGDVASYYNLSTRHIFKDLIPSVLTKYRRVNEYQGAATTSLTQNNRFNGALLSARSKSITGINVSNAATVTSTAHGYNIGDAFVLSGITGTGAISALNGQTVWINAVTTNTYNIGQYSPIGIAATLNSFTGSTSGNTLTVSGSVTGSAIAIGQQLNGVSGTPIIIAGSGLIWTFSGPPQTVASTTLTTNTLQFNGVGQTMPAPIYALPPANTPVQFTTSFGGLTAGSVYYICSTGNQYSIIRISATPGGACLPLTGTSCAGGICFPSIYFPIDTTGGTYTSGGTTTSLYIAQGNPDLTTPGDRSIDYADVIAYAPYAGGVALYNGPDNGFGNAPNATNVPFYNSLIAAVEANNNSLTASLVDQDIYAGRGGILYVACSGTNCATYSDAAHTTPAASNMIAGGNIQFSNNGGTGYSGIPTNRIYNVSSVSSTTPVTCGAATNCNFTFSGFANGSPTGVAVNVGTLGTGNVDVGLVGQPNAVNFRTTSYHVSNWFAAGEFLAASYDSFRASNGLQPLRVEWYEGNLEPVGLTAAQCTTLGITTPSPVTITFNATTSTAANNNLSNIVVTSGSGSIFELMNGMTLSGGSPSNITAGSVISSINGTTNVASATGPAPTASGAVTGITATGTCASEIARGIYIWKTSSLGASGVQKYFNGFMGLDPSLSNYGLMTHSKTPAWLVMLGSSADSNFAGPSGNAYSYVNGSLPTSPVFQTYNGAATFTGVP